MTANDITITVTREVALALCDLAGLAPDERGRYGGAFWALDEAAREAIVFLAAGDDLPTEAQRQSADQAAWLAER